MPSVAVVGGSLGGLTASLVLADAGCDVTVLERSSRTLEARGAGICVLDETVRWFAERTTTDPDDLCSSTSAIRFLDADGAVVHQRAHAYRFSSWNTIYRALLEQLPAQRYRLGAEVAAFADEEGGGGAAYALATGERGRADLLVHADGIGSAARSAMFPQVRPRYSGYVAWRGTVVEADLPEAVQGALADAITYQVMPDSHVLVYPIPGLGGEREPGKRLVNAVWYRNVAEGADFRDLMTDRTGRIRPVSLPPGSARPELVDALRADARQRLAPPIADVVTALPEPFVQAVYDIDVPAMVRGRSCLIGDAAFAVRPHAAAGTAKAAADGWELAAQLRAAGGDVPAALRAWERRQLGLGRALLERNREIGDSSQFRGTFTPGDPKLLFGLRGPGR